MNLEAERLSVEDRQALHDLKYRYLRGVDAKEWDTLASTLTADAVARYGGGVHTCLLYTSPSPRDLSTSRMPSSA